MVLAEVQRILERGTVTQLKKAERTLRDRAEQYAHHIREWPGIADAFEADADRMRARRLELERS